MKKKKGEKLDPEETRDIVMNFLIGLFQFFVSLFLSKFKETIL